MSAYQTICILAALAFTLAFLNQYLMRMQTTIAITSGALVVSISLMVLGKTLWPDLGAFAVDTLDNIDFPDFVLQGVLGPLLFAGGLGINLQAMRHQKWEIAFLVVFGVVCSTVLVGAGLWLLGELLGLHIPLVYCLLFGAIISPTDPIAVLAIVKKLNAPESIAIQLEGESLFNDGIGLVMFLTVYAIAFGTADATPLFVMELLAHEVIGGLLFGVLVGLLAHVMISATHDGPMELGLTMCVPTAGFVVANMLGVSGALAMVVAGIIVGNWTRRTGFSVEGRLFLDKFWALLDEALNALLFLMIGLAMVLIPYQAHVGLLSIGAVALVVATRFATVGVSFAGFRRFRNYHKYSVRILSWGGLRGALSLAMAISVPAGVSLAGGELELRSMLVAITYSVVIFSIIVQGITIAPIVRWSREEETRAQGQNGTPSRLQPAADAATGSS